MAERRYKAFISYSHRDKAVAEWLHGALESYRLPPGLDAKGVEDGLRPIFKDREELPASENLGEAIKSALADSDALIVLCSPSAAISPWIAKEIDLFKRQHGDANVFPAVVDGEPPYNMPPPLLVHYENGEPTEEPAEPAAADLRAEADGRKLGLLKLAAGLAGVRLDELVDREAQRRHRRLVTVAALSFIGMVVAIGLAVFAIQQRNTARAERAEANGLIEYMLTDLREELEPVGRLDVLDGVGARAMEYYARQKLDDLSPDELGRRARAVQLVAEMHNLRGDNDKALPAFRQAARTTGELLARDPDDPERMFNHGQSLFWVGYIAWQRGQLDEAKEALGEYADISTRLAQRDRSNLDWQMEEAYAQSNLGTLAGEEGRHDDALPLFERSAEVTERVANAEGRPAARLIELGESLSWVASTEQFLGNFSEAETSWREELKTYDEVLEREPDNVDALRPAMFAMGRLGWLLSITGKQAEARKFLDQAVALAEQLREREPDHTWTIEMSVSPYMDRANLNWRQGRREAASRDFDRVASLLDDLSTRDPKNKSWNIDRPAGLQLVRALTVRANMPPAEKRALASQWLAKLNPQDSSHVWPRIAAHTLDAQAHSNEGNRAAAAQAYARALAIESGAAGVDINAIALRAIAAERLGQGALAHELRGRLKKLGVDPAIDDRITGG